MRGTPNNDTHSANHGKGREKWEIGNDGKFYSEEYERQQVEIDLANRPGGFDPKSSGKKHRFGLFSEAVAAASTALGNKDRTKRQTRETRLSAPTYIEPRISSADSRPADASRHGARSPKSSTATPMDDHDFAPGAGYSWDASRGARVRDQDINRTQNTRNIDSFGSTTTQPGSTFLDESEEAQPEPLSARNKDNFTTSDHLELKSIENCVLRARLDFPELKGPKHESTEEAVIRFVEQYERLSAPLRDSKGRLDTAEKMRKDLYKAEDELRDAKGQLSAWSRDYKELKTRHLQETDQLKRTIDKLRFENNEQVSSHGAKLRKEQSSLQREKDQLKTMFEGQLRKMRDDSALQAKTINDLKAQINQERTQWNAAVKRLEGDKGVLESRLRSAQSEHDSRLREVEEKSENRLHRERGKYEELITSLESQIAQLKNKAQEELLTQKEQLIKEHEEESQQLRTVIEDFKVTVTQREHFKGLTDRDVAGHFLRLANDIEDFSRLEWDFRKEQDWPFTEDQLRQFNPKNTRKLKQQMVQNTMWVVLYDHVFRSPFRILGIDGKDIDADWADIYSPDASPYEWPNVPAELERSRYESAKAFLGAIEPSAPQGRLKEGYEESVMTAVNAVCHALDKVATVEARNRKILEGILRLSAKVWLELCSQRYRLIVILSSGSGDILSSMGTDAGFLRLIVRPDLKRYGDSQGKDLARGESVAGWKTLVESYPS